MEMIEQEIRRHVSGKCVQDRADRGRAEIPHVLPDIHVGREGRHGVLERVEPAHDIHKPGRREDRGDPKRRVAERIEGLPSDERGAEVKEPGPAPISGTHSVVPGHRKGNLLRVKVSG